MTDLPINAPSPRLCHIVKWPDFDGYGFNLHADKTRPGQYIGKVDEKSPADVAGLKEGDKIIEVNGVNISNENHKQVVQRIKAVSNETRLLVVDDEADSWYKSHSLVVRGDQSNIIQGTSQSPSSPEPPVVENENNLRMNDEDNKSVGSASSSHSENSTHAQQDDNSNNAKDNEITDKEPQPELELQPQPETQPEPQPELEPETQSELDTQSEPELERQPETQSKLEPELQLEPEREPELQPEREPELQLEPEMQPKPELQLEPEMQPKPELQPELQPEPQPEPETQPKPELQSEPEPSLTLEDDRSASGTGPNECSSPKDPIELDPTPEYDNVRFESEENVKNANNKDTAESLPSEDRHSLSSRSSSASCNATKHASENAESLPDTEPEQEEQRKSPMSTTPSPPPSLNPEGSLSNQHSSPRNSSPTSTTSGLNLNMTAAEMRAHLATRKKFDPRRDAIDLKKKYEIVQNM